jgi:aminoglycoside phosphotransferase (APT) family kinase protein
VTAVEDLAAPLAGWLSAQRGVATTVEELVAPTHGGYSATTLLVRTDAAGGGRDLVVRLDAPAEELLFPDAPLVRQAALLAALHADGTVPVPLVLAYEPDPSVLGRPFLVMPKVEGRVPPDRPGLHFAGWVKEELSPEQQARLLDSGLASLAAIHAVPVTGAVATAVPGGPDPLAAESARWRSYLDWATGGEAVPRLEAAFDELDRRRPAIADGGLVWGDARLGNLIYGPDLAVEAVLDWEMAVLGPPELDVGWYRFLERVALGFADQLPGFPDLDGIVARYEDLAGRRVRELAWFEAWGGLRTACIQLRLATRRGVPVAKAVERDPTLSVLEALLSAG